MWITMTKATNIITIIIIMILIIIIINTITIFDSYLDDNTTTCRWLGWMRTSLLENIGRVSNTPFFDNFNDIYKRTKYKIQDIKNKIA